MTHTTVDLFESLIGQDLTVAAANGAEPWRVVSVKRGQAHALRSDQPFNVYLTAPASCDRKQGIRSAHMPDGEALEFFAVPISATNEALTFEVIFN